MSTRATQRKQSEWSYQWSHYEDDAPSLFHDWIRPNTLDDFRAKRVLDAGCGPGHHCRIAASVAAHVTGVDLNTSALARERLSDLENVSFLEADIATLESEELFDVVYCIGVIHHTDDPDATFENLRRLCRPGGRVIVWCYSREGNALVRLIVEPLRRLFLSRTSRGFIRGISMVATALLYPLVYTLYLLPLESLPYHEYFRNFRRLGWQRNVLNVFDKLNAPQTQFISRERVESWFRPERFEDVSIEPYRGVSWRASGTVRRD